MTFNEDHNQLVGWKRMKDILLKHIVTFTLEHYIWLFTNKSFLLSPTVMKRIHFTGI